MPAVHAAVEVEREAKLVAPTGLALPDISGIVPGARMVAQPDERLVATYYDTSDLRLARSGITVRHRSGEAGPAWTVKFPDDADATSVSRHEVRIDGTEQVVPDLAADIVLASRRTRPLEPVARITTARRRTALVDADGRALAEVADDTVSVAGAHGGARSFREVEVELLDRGDAVAGLLDAAAALLVGAGCRAEAPIPKLVRALGDDARKPADVVVPEIDADATAAELVRHALARCVAAMLRHDPGVRLGGDEEAVHDFRVATRRLRSDLRSFAVLLDRGALAHVRSELSWLGALVGVLRDTDVLAGRLARDLAELPARDREAAEPLVAHLGRQAASARDDLLAAMRDERYVLLVDSLVEVARVPPLRRGSRRATAPAAAHVSSVARRPWQRLVTGVRALGEEPSDAALHRVRILAKRCRYAAEAVAPVAGPGAARFASAVADVQTLLGDHQDAVVAQAFLAGAAGLAAGREGDRELRAVIAALIELERSRQSELRSRWPGTWRAASAKDLRRWL